MKIKIVLMMVVGLVLVSAANAQKVGGYKLVTTSTAGVQEAAEYAVEAQAKKTGRAFELVAVLKAERQTVAGANYRLCLKVTSEGAANEADAIIYVQAVVYVDLKGGRKLTSWSASDCDEDDDDNDLF